MAQTLIRFDTPVTYRDGRQYTGTSVRSRT